MLVYATQIGACNDLMGPGSCVTAHFHQGSYTAAEMFLKSSHEFESTTGQKKKHYCVFA